MTNDLMVVVLEELRAISNKFNSIRTMKGDFMALLNVAFFFHYVRNIATIKVSKINTPRGINEETKIYIE